MNSQTVLAILLLAVGEDSLPAGELSIPSSSVGGGGSSAGGTFSVRGTVGETTPPMSALTGGSFSMSGGFASRIAVILTPDAPRLTLLRTAGGFRISWPLPAEGFLLQEAPALPGSGPIAWVSSLVTPVDQDGRRAVNLPTAGPARFFRLIKAP